MEKNIKKGKYEIKSNKVIVDAYGYDEFNHTSMIIEGDSPYSGKVLVNG